MPTSTTEEATVCEIWNGADYQYKVTTVAESDANPALPAEQVVGASFSAGSLTPTTISGAAVGPSETIDPTTFAMVQATAAEQQASIDDPYYGVFSGCQPPIIQCEPSGSVTGANAMVVPGDLGGRYARHGVRRRGVRALIDRAEEVGRGIGGERRFREQRGDGEVIYAVDPQTELLVAQEFHSPREHVIARHTWVPVRRGHVRKRTDVEFTEIRDGKTLRSRTTIDVRDLTIGGVPVQ